MLMILNIQIISSLNKVTTIVAGQTLTLLTVYTCFDCGPGACRGWDEGLCSCWKVLPSAGWSFVPIKLKAFQVRGKSQNTRGTLDHVYSEDASFTGRYQILSMWRISIGFIASVPFLPRISPELRWGSCDTQYRRSSGMPIHCFRSTTYRLLTALIYAWIPDLDKIHVLTLSSCQEHGEYVRDSGLDINDPKLYGSINSRIEGNDDDGDTPQKLGSGPDSKLSGPCYMDCTKCFFSTSLWHSTVYGPRPISNS